MRKLNARCWKFLVYTVFGVNLHDLDCAFKVMRTRFLHEHPLETRGAMINAELVYKFLRAGMSYQEVGVHHYSRVAGVATGARPRVILKALRDVCVYASKWACEEQKIGGINEGYEYHRTQNVH